MSEPSEPILTKDGSYTLYDPRTQQHYHSLHGARQESLHVFIENGLNACAEKESIRVMELGFGTGLNAILSLEWALESQKKVHFLSFDLYPLTDFSFLPPTSEGQESASNDFWLQMMEADWNLPIDFNPVFQLEKKSINILDALLPIGAIDVIFHDAFSPDSEPDLWNPNLLEKMYHSLTPGGIWVSYSAKGQLRRDLISCGFDVEKLPGPPGKREMLRAIKP